MRGVQAAESPGERQGHNILPQGRLALGKAGTPNDEAKKVCKPANCRAVLKDVCMPTTGR